MSTSQLHPPATSAIIAVGEQVLAWHTAGCWIGGGAAAVIGASWLLSWLCRRPCPAPVLPTSAPPAASPAPAYRQNAPPAASPAQAYRQNAPPAQAYGQHYAPPAPYPQHITYIIEAGDGVGAAIAAGAGFCAIM